MTRSSPWDRFFEERMKKIFTDGAHVLDIGGGLRVDPSKNNRKAEHAWLAPYIAKTRYVVLDKVADYNPDIVGDIHALPFPDNSIDAIICISVLEHVEDPWRAMREMHRVLAPGGFCYIDAPFLFYYHPMNGYYKDYFRFTRDGLELLASDFSSVELQSVHGALASVMNLLPFFSKRVRFFDWLDARLGKSASNQTSGYRVFCIK